MKPIIKALLLCLLTVHLSVFAHRDTKLTLNQDGSIAQLPPQYADIRLQIEFVPKNSNAVTQLVLQSNEKTYQVPECALKPIRSRSMNEVKLSGSWYHNAQRLPHYINVHFSDSTGGVDYLFNLQSPNLISIDRWLVISSQTTQIKPLPFEALCPNQN